ncbi:ankyrin repeat domain-containing protein [Umezawaea sp. Da 62-37]|uniref:ankyrin repeat domain-containing protein n=1 Tax=Umezawaea sp. Da 62-37 TaxID=3075927 RepID=UPI0028F739BE|nr:ankyrin repeat domain-containing protein [Umezawaea sp. Da 62-37]WNV91195.1 ankyrin repeat domain-containing protein [Umezawaea sp. Da 62-37]
MAADWTRMALRAWADHAEVLARLDAGADPNPAGRFTPPLHMAASHGSPEVVAELAGRVDDVEALHSSRSALWLAVVAGRSDNARALVAAGADPWRPVMAGWSAGRLGLAGPDPDLFARPDGEPGLSPSEAAEAAEAKRLIAALGTPAVEGFGFAFVAGIDAAEAERRLRAVRLDVPGPISDIVGGDPLDDGNLLVMGVTDVPGGCVVSQAWAFGPSMPGVVGRLSVGTTCFGLYANPKSGHQGTVAHDRVFGKRHLSPSSGPDLDDTPEEALAAYLYQRHAVARCLARVGLRPTDARAVTGPPDAWLRLPAHDYWTWSEPV